MKCFTVCLLASVLAVQFIVPALADEDGGEEMVGGVAPGGVGEEQVGDESAQAVANNVRAKIVQKLGGAKKVREFVVVKYRTQLVGGMNYILKIRVAPGKFVHAQVFEPFGRNPDDYELNGFDANKKEGDSLENVTAL